MMVEERRPQLAAAGRGGGKAKCAQETKRWGASKAKGQRRAPGLTLAPPGFWIMRHLRPSYCAARRSKSAASYASRANGERSADAAEAAAAAAAASRALRRRVRAAVLWCGGGWDGVWVKQRAAVAQQQGRG